MPVNDLIQIRKGTTGEWLAINPVLASGEPGFDSSLNTLKIGDGAKAYSSLPLLFSNIYTSGSGTTNYLSKWTGAGLLSNSTIYDNGTNVGIGTSSPLYKLDVSGSGRFTSININGVYTFPTGAGSANQYLKTDGAGNLSWSTIAGTGSGTAISVTGSAPLTSANITGAGSVTVNVSGANIVISGSNSGGGGSDTLYIGDGSSTVISYASNAALNIVASGGTSVSYNDTNNTITISSPTTIRGSEIVLSDKAVFNTTHYASGNLDVYYNGFKLLINDDYTANGGTTFTLLNTATSGDIVEWIGSSVSSLSYAPISHRHNSSDISFLSSTLPTSSASGTQGQIVWDSNYIYVCVNTNTWKRASLTPW